jgi:hypothetical protein
MIEDEKRPDKLNIVAGGWDLLFVLYVITDPSVLGTLLKLYRW